MYVKHPKHYQNIYPKPKAISESAVVFLLVILEPVWVFVWLTWQPTRRASGTGPAAGTSVWQSSEPSVLSEKETRVETSTEIFYKTI